MNRIDDKFQKLKAQKRQALIAYLTLGFPDLETNLAQIRQMDRRGVGLVEIGIPFSDPTADGPVIQESSRRSLARGTTLSDAFALAASVRKNSDIPLLLMGYLNPFLSVPAASLAADMARAGLDGLIVPDLPPEEAGRIRGELDRREIRLVFLAAPNSPPERIRLIARSSGGFVYCVSRTGVTGGETEAGKGLARMVGRIRRHTRTPVCVGFGIRNRRQLERIWEFADGAIVGSALIKPFLEESSPRRGLARSLALLDLLLD